MTERFAVSLRLLDCAERHFGIIYDEETDTYTTATDYPIYDADGNPLPPEQRPFPVVETGESVFNEEIQIDTSSGARRWLLINVTPISTEDGTVERLIAAGEVITALKTHANRLEHWRDELGENGEMALLKSSPVGTNGNAEYRACTYLRAEMRELRRTAGHQRTLQINLLAEGDNTSLE